MRPPTPSKRRLAASLVALAIFFAAAPPARSTVVVRLDVQELTAGAATVVHGRVLRSWVDWDQNRTAIWTHYEVQVDAVWKGDSQKTIRISEPGGELNGVRMTVPGAPRYEVGQEVVVFAAEVPNGYLRTHGWSQGRFLVEESPLSPSGKRVHTDLGDLVLTESSVKAGAPKAAAPALDGRDLGEFRRLIESLVAGEQAQ